MEPFITMKKQITDQWVETDCTREPYPALYATIVVERWSLRAWLLSLFRVVRGAS